MLRSVSSPPWDSSSRDLPKFDYRFFLGPVARAAPPPIVVPTHVPHSITSERRRSFEHQRSPQERRRSFSDTSSRSDFFSKPRRERDYIFGECDEFSDSDDELQDGQDDAQHRGPPQRSPRGAGLRLDLGGVSPARSLTSQRSASMPLSSTRVNYLPTTPKSVRLPTIRDSGSHQPQPPKTLEPQSSLAVPDASSGSHTQRSNATSSNAGSPPKSKKLLGKTPSYKGKYDRDMVLMLRDLYEDLMKNGSLSEQRALTVNNLQEKAPRLNETIRKVLLNMVDDGSLSFRKLLDIMFPNANKRDLAAMMALAYPPKDGMSSKVLAMSSRQRAELEEVFRSFDEDNSGSISLMEMIEATKQLGIDASESRKIMESIDTNGDGIISLDEFITWLRPIYFG